MNHIDEIQNIPIYKHDESCIVDDLDSNLHAKLNIRLYESRNPFTALLVDLKNQVQS